jgi:hypothetical protein
MERWPGRYKADYLARRARGGSNATKCVERPSRSPGFARTWRGPGVAFAWRRTPIFRCQTVDPTPAWLVVRSGCIGDEGRTHMRTTMSARPITIGYCLSLTGPRFKRLGGSACI